MGAPVQPSFTQRAFYFAEDDNFEVLNTVISAISGSITRKPYSIFRLRIRIEQTVSNANTALARNYKLRYSLNSGSYTDVGAQGSATPIRYANSSFITDNEVTTQGLYFLDDPYLFISGRVDENGDTGTITYSSGQLSCTEVEFVLELNGTLLNVSDTLDLRVYETNNTVLASYAETPRISRSRRSMVLG